MANGWSCGSSPAMTYIDMGTKHISIHDTRLKTRSDSCVVNFPLWLPAAALRPRPGVVGGGALASAVEAAEARAVLELRV